MKSKAKIENMLCFIDLKQNFSIENDKAKEHGFKDMANLNAFLFSPFKNSQIKFILFPYSGKVFLIGVKSSKEIESCFWFLIKKLKELCPNTRIKPDTEIETQNVLVTANLKDYFFEKDFEINLEKLALDKNAEYDPKKFPGVFLRFLSSPEDKNPYSPILGTALVFRSGKILVGDVKNLEDANLILEKIIEKVK